MNSRQLMASLLACAALAAASPARSAITPEARAVLDRYVAAAGGREAWEATRSMHAKGSIEAFGLKGTIESWRRAPARRASVVSIGPFTIRDWNDGEKAWRTDPSGKLLALDGKDLEDALASGWFENERWLEPDQGGGSITLAGEVKDSLGTRDVLEITPPVGKPRRVEFDRIHRLPVRMVSKNDQRTIVLTFSDYRKAMNWSTSFRSKQELEGMSANTAVVQLDSMWLRQPLADALFQPPAAGAGAVTWLKTVNVARIPFEYQARHVWVRASVNGGPPADFLYDTGASITVIDSAYAAKIGLATEGKMQATGAGAGGGASFGKLEKLRLVTPDADGVELGDVKVAVLDVNSVLAPFFWRECAGVIGFDVIVQFVNRIDFDRKNLFLFEPGSWRYEGTAAAIPMTLGGHTPVVKVKVDGKYEGEARIDVGSGSTLDLHTPFVKKHGLAAAAKRSLAVTGGGFGGTFESRLARMTRLEIGPHTIDAPLIGLSSTTEGALASEDFAGNIGNRLLERFRVTLDYERRNVYLEPGERFAERERFSMIGAQFARFGDAIRAGQVLKDSPAARAGLRVGDDLLAVDGKPPLDWGADALDARFENAKPGERVVLTVRRDGKTRTLEVTLRELL